MQFKKGNGWKACYDEKTFTFTAERGSRGFYQLYEINKDIYEDLDPDDTDGKRNNDCISSGRILFEADDDYYTPPYYMVFDERYNEIAPWADAKRRADLMDEHERQRAEQEAAKKEEEQKQLKLLPFYKAILDADTAPIVVCNTGHEIIYMNPAACEKYAKWGGYDLIGKSLLDCHNEQSRKMIDKVVDFFLLSNQNNIVHTFYNEKENKDVYMVALRSEIGGLMGYYEKHEYRTKDTTKFYDMGE